MQSEIHKQSANHSVQLRTCDIVTLVQSTTYKSPDVNQILGLLKIVPYDRVQFQHKAVFHREGPNLKVPRSIWWFKTLHRCCHGGSNRFKKTRYVQTYQVTLQTKLRNTLEFISWKNAIFRICNSFRYKSSSVLLTVPIIWWFEHKLAFACPCDYIPRLFSCKTSTTIINNCKQPMTITTNACSATPNVWMDLDNAAVKTASVSSLSLQLMDNSWRSLIWP